MEELAKAVGDLAVSSLDSSLVDRSLETIISSLGSDENVREDRVKLILESNLTGVLKTQLTSGSCCHETAIRLIAELAKSDAARQQCTADGLIAPLLNVLSSGNVSAAVQACRALGNICFDNDNARCEVCEQNGVDCLLELLSAQLALEPNSSNMLRKVACGFLFNLINTHESVIEKALSLGAASILNEYIVKFGRDEDVMIMVLLAIGSLADSEMGRSKIASYKMVETISGLLVVDDVGIELQETILELFASLSECDEIKVQLASHEQFDRLMNVMRRSQETGVDRVTVVNLVADLVVLLLTGDESMKLLYDDGKGRILTEALDWMKSSSEHLQNSGALVIGNIARSDSHCVQLVENGITAELLALLSRHPVDDGSTVAHHAIFSSLRNLAIPAANKPIMLQQNFLDKVLPYAESPMSTVLFKLLGTLRMIVDGQEAAAISLGTNDAFVSKLAGWCKVKDHEGVRGEANRLVASLVKNSRCRNVMDTIVSCSALEHLVGMLTAEHVVMQNEAIIALTLMATVMAGSVAGHFVDLDIVSRLKDVITKNSTIVELLHNCLTLVKCLSTLDVLREQLTASGFQSIIADLQKHENAQLKALASSISLSG